MINSRLRERARTDNSAFDALRIYVILNPKAGSKQADRVHDVLRRYFSGPGRYEVYETGGDEDMVRIVTAALDSGYNRVFVAGGDGTVSAVVDALVGTGVPLGIIPAGTSNALAREFRIPLDVEEAMALLAGGHSERTIDALKIGHHYYVLRVGIGFDAIVLDQTQREEKRRLGPLAYLWTGIKKLDRLRPHRFTLTIDGREHGFRAAQVMLINAAASSLPVLDWGRKIRPDDGRIDVCILSGRGLAEHARVLWHNLRDGEERGEHIDCLSARRRITVASRTPQPVHGDGDIIGTTPITAEVVPAAIQLIVPGRQVN